MLALGLRGALAQRLENTAPTAYVLERCQRAGRNTPVAVAVELVRCQRGFRRLPEAHRLGELWLALEVAIRMQPAGAASGCQG